MQDKAHKNSSGWNSVLSESRDAYLKYVGDWEEKIGSFIEFDIDRISGAAESDVSHQEGALAGVPFGVKDNFAVESFNITCGSKILEGVASPYTASSVKNLQDAGAVVVVCVLPRSDLCLLSYHQSV